LREASINDNQRSKQFKQQLQSVNQNHNIEPKNNKIKGVEEQRYQYLITQLSLKKTYDWGKNNFMIHYQRVSYKKIEKRHKKLA